jgi:hypothetical protein
MAGKLISPIICTTDINTQLEIQHKNLPGILTSTELTYLGISPSFLNHVISGDGYPVASQTSFALSPSAAVEAEGAEMYG